MDERNFTFEDFVSLRRTQPDEYYTLYTQRMMKQTFSRNPQSFFASYTGSM
jgi:hypothetical protein